MTAGPRHHDNLQLMTEADTARNLMSSEEAIRSLTAATASSSRTTEPAARFSVACNPHCFSGVQYGETPFGEESSPDFRILGPVAIRGHFEVFQKGLRKA